MTFADVIDKPQSIRFTMVRVTPARCINSALTTSGGGGYIMTWSQPVARIERNGVALTRVDLLTGDDQYIVSESGIGPGSIEMQLAAAPDDTTNVIVLYYYLFFTSSPALMANTDPLDTSTELRQWEPRIAAEPQLSQTVQNVISGVLSLADMSIELANADAALNQWLGPNDSFNAKDVDCWIGVRARQSDAPAFEYVAKGKVHTVVVSAETVELQLRDSFDLLAQPAFMGDAPHEAYYQATADSYPNVDPQKAGQPVPFFIGRWSRYETENDPQLSGGVFQALDPSKMPEAVCTSFNATISTSNNRAWTLGRIPAEGFRSWTMPAFTGVPSGGGGTTVPSYLFFGVDAATLAAADVAVGDRVELTESGIGSHNARVCEVDTVGGTVGLIFNSQTNFSFTNAATVTAFDSPQLVLVDENGAQYYLTPGVDYTASTAATSGSNLVVTVTFFDNFEAGLVPSNGFPATFPGPLDPSKHRIHFRLRLAASSDAKHGDVLSKMMTSAGLSVDATSFSDANSALAVNCAFQIPYFDETDYQPYLKYAENLLASTLGFVSLDSTGKVQYLLLGAPSASDGTDDNVILGDGGAGLTVTVDYNDVVTGLIAYNPHNASAAAIGASPSPSETRYNLKAQYLHGIQNAVQFVHVLETITDRIDALLAARSNRRATYGYQTATRYLDAKIGDDAQLSPKFMLGDGSAASVKIISLQKSADNVAVQAIDLLGVT